ncbi:uncharacterized protein EI90DRAFT_3048205 [Cantharellus anzutake]|uniref:uncharacterized protein n=1 Tax=Cantharellus anzutake TaxID=1750568 RepID=UPI001906441E|nr:uncharacterized protein EI90DRAFT_3048205 [Cantharellus anzutake]KAF8335401.1 hypothetical protein EI90DRAFT_3048205 [Cantharellus anzutake]
MFGHWCNISCCMSLLSLLHLGRLEYSNPSTFWNSGPTYEQPDTRVLWLNVHETISRPRTHCFLHTYTLQKNAQGCCVVMVTLATPLPTAPWAPGTLQSIGALHMTCSQP